MICWERRLTTLEPVTFHQILRWHTSGTPRLKLRLVDPLVRKSGWYSCSKAILELLEAQVLSVTPHDLEKCVTGECEAALTAVRKALNISPNEPEVCQFKRLEPYL